MDHGEYLQGRQTAKDFSSRKSLPRDRPKINNMPWVDIHNHVHTISWTDREELALMGCQASILIAYAHQWVPYRPISPEDVRFLWDDALVRMEHVRKKHFYEVKLGVGIHMGAYVENHESLLDVMPAYCELEEVAAIGEIGVTKTQDAVPWALEDQREVLREQMSIARATDTPVILHTPPTVEDESHAQQDELTSYDVDPDLQTEPVLTSDNPSLEATKIDIECKDEANLSDKQVVVSHADPSIVPYLMENTNCYLSFTVGYPWLTGVTAGDVVVAVQEYGPDRIMIDSDSAGTVRGETSSIKRTIHQMYRQGIEMNDIKRVVYDNPKEVFDLEFPTY